jgi:predicted nucleic acid-binding protein
MKDGAKRFSLCLDASVIIEILNQPNSEVSIELVSATEGTDSRIVFSVIILCEVLYSKAQGDLLQSIQSLFIDSEILFVEVTSEIARLAGELRKEYKLKTPDAIHAATAIVTNCDAFCTFDKDLKGLNNRISLWEV